MAKPQFAFSTKPLSVTSVCFSTGDTKYILMKILELEQVKELLTMAFQ